MHVQLAGGEQGTLLSEAGPALLPFFNTRDACVLRLVCQEFLAAVREYPWADGKTAIQGSIAAWRSCFPRALSANIQRMDWAGFNQRWAPVVDADFVHFEGLRKLRMGSCTSVTDAAFVHLHGIRALDMSNCDQLTITDAAFAHLAGIKRLSIWGCDQATITDAAFAHLRGIQRLNMSSCTQFTDAAFPYLRGIHTLIMARCRQTAITDAAFVHLQGVRKLVMDYCRQDTITGATFSFLTGKGIYLLDMYNCRSTPIYAAQSLELPVRRKRRLFAYPL